MHSLERRLHVVSLHHSWLCGRHGDCGLQHRGWNTGSAHKGNCTGWTHSAGLPMPQPYQNERQRGKHSVVFCESRL